MSCHGDTIVVDSDNCQDDGIPLVQRRRSQACTYHFYPVILALNHEIRNEALDTLRANHFVVVSHQIVGLDVAKHWNDLPIVTEYASHVARFKQHALRIHIKASAPLLNPIPGHHEKVKSFLMIAKDLPAFATVMRFFFYTIRPNADTLFVAKPLAAKEHEVQELTTLLPAHRGDIVTQIHLRNLAGRSPDPSVAEKWLQPLYNCIYGRQKVIVLNCEGRDDFVKSLQLAMGPKTIWPTAIAWHMLAGLRGLKQDADELAESGDYKTASIQYGKMWHLSGSYLLFHLEDVAYEMDLTFPLALVCQVLLDAATMTILLDLRTRQDSHMQFVGVLEQIGRMTSRLPYGLRRLGGFFNGVPSGQLFHASSLWMMKTMYFLSFRDAATLDDLVSTFDMIQGYAPDDERIAHDAAFVKETATNPVVSTPPFTCETRSMLTSVTLAPCDLLE